MSIYSDEIKRKISSGVYKIVGVVPNLLPDYEKKDAKRFYTKKMINKYMDYAKYNKGLLRFSLND